MFRSLTALLEQVDGIDVGWRDPVLDELAGVAYRRLVEWLGPPADEGARWRIVRGRSSAMARNPFGGDYYLVIGEDANTPAEQAAALAHEMCHRVTSRCKGLARECWVDEMVAVLTSTRLLGEFGYTRYAADLQCAYSGGGTALSVAELRRVRSSRLAIAVGRDPYPPGFTTGIVEVGNRLVAIVGWEGTCRLPRALTWRRWLEGLPDAVRGAAAALLGPAICWPRITTGSSRR